MTGDVVTIEIGEWINNLTFENGKVVITLDKEIVEEVIDMLKEVGGCE